MTFQSVSHSKQSHKHSSPYCSRSFADQNPASQSSLWRCGWAVHAFLQKKHSCQPGCDGVREHHCLRGQKNPRGEPNRCPVVFHWTYNLLMLSTLVYKGDERVQEKCRNNQRKANPGFHGCRVFPERKKRTLGASSFFVEIEMLRFRLSCKGGTYWEKTHLQRLQINLSDFLVAAADAQQWRHSKQSYRLFLNFRVSLSGTDSYLLGASYS